MPTWRNNGSDFLKQSGIDFKRLEEALQTTHSCFILKLHPFTQMDLSVIKGYSHIIPFEKQCDVNTILPYTNCLITDWVTACEVDKSFPAIGFTFKPMTSSGPTKRSQAAFRSLSPVRYNIPDLSIS